MKNRLISGILFIGFGGLIALGPQSLFKVCRPMEGHLMKCFGMARAELGIGALISVLGVLLMVFKADQIRMALSTSLGLTNIVALLIPTVLIGVCNTHAMHCRTTTLPALSVFSILGIVTAVTNIIYLYRATKKPEHNP